MSGIIDELRAMAESVGLAMPQAATLMMGAADTIEGFEAENAKLRNEVDNLLDFEHLTSVAVAYAGCDECGEYKQTMLHLFVENAKLREFAHDLLQPILAEGFDCYGCVHEDCDGMQHTDRCKLLDRARELEVEVE